MFGPDETWKKTLDMGDRVLDFLVEHTPSSFNSGDIRIIVSFFLGLTWVCWTHMSPIL